ncbi:MULTISPECIES: DNA glycosylase AlkZ-like family protein [Polaromonas]|uniref:DNA glycosylase AlkZ-like family protein n=1 Tax=Polaromonas aquatica TaxID=332657 RepID=A0ABW1TZT7_9BURK
MPTTNIKAGAMPALPVTALRLHNQQITQSGFKTPAQVRGWLGGIQGQDYSGAKWSLGLRLPGATDHDIEKAIEKGSIVRTWPMRGTLHFVAASDVHWLLALTAPRNIAANARLRRELELDQQTFGRSAEILIKALQGGQQRTRDELYALFARAAQRYARFLGKAAEIF